MTKDLSVQKELNYAFCHTVTVNLMCTESRINNLSKAADTLLSTLLRLNYPELLNIEGTKEPPEDGKLDFETNIKHNNYVRIHLSKF